MDQTNEGPFDAGDPFRQLANPWELLNAVKTLTLEDRQPYLQQWLDLVGKQPAGERDALLSAGRDVYKYRMDTARGALRQIEEVTRGLSRSTVSIANDDLIAEAIYRPGHEPELGFMVHYFSKPDDPPVFHEFLEVGKAVYYPPDSRMITANAVLFPSGYEEYQDDQTLHRDMLHYSTTYVERPMGSHHLDAAYARSTWMADRFDATGYRRWLGDYASGKTRSLQTTGSICYCPMFAAGATTASPIFRLIDKFHGTLILDEMDFFKRDDVWRELEKILNTGYTRGFPVLRAERGIGDSFDVIPYDCFGPKLLATREHFADPALESRCLTTTTELLGNLRADLPSVFDKEARQWAQRLRNKLLLWRFRNYQHVKVDPREVVPGVESRTRQVLLPLLACVTDPDLRSLLITNAQEAAATAQDNRRGSLEGRLLTALQATLPRAMSTGMWTVHEVADSLNFEVPDRSRVSEDRVGRKLTALGFRRTRAPGKRAAYVYDGSLLAKRLYAYGLSSPTRIPM